MANLLLAVIYLAFISLGLPDSLLGSAWPAMFPALHVPVSYWRSFGFGRSPCYRLGLRTDLSGHYACHSAIVRRRKRTNIYWASARQRIRRIFDSPAAVWSAVQSYLTVFVCAVYRFDSAAHACHVPAHDEKVPYFRQINPVVCAQKFL